MEKFGLFNALQTTFSLPGAADSQNSFAEKIASSLQAAEQIAALFQNEAPCKTPEVTPSSTADRSSDCSASSALYDSSAQTSSAATAAPESFDQNKQNKPDVNVPKAAIRKKSCGDTYADFIRRQEALSKKIGDGK